MNGVKQRERSAEMCPAACASLWRLPRLFGDDTCGGRTAKVGVRARTTLCVVHCVGVLRAWPTDKCSNEDVGENERETPAPL